MKNKKALLVSFFVITLLVMFLASCSQEKKEEKVADSQSKTYKVAISLAITGPT